MLTLPPRKVGYKKRNHNGQQLVELVVAVALSGFFVLLISGLLSQAMAVSSLSQSELLANSCLELLLENARSTTYDQTASLAAQQPINFVVNMTTPGDLFPVSRQLPVQLDLTSSDHVYGTVSPLQKQVIPSNQWSNGNGNYFRATAQETLQDSTGLTGIPSYQVTVTITYTDSNGNTQKTKRGSVTVFQNGVTLL